MKLWRFTVLIFNNKAEKRVVNDKGRRWEYPMKSESYMCICVGKILKLIDLLKEKYLFVVKPKLRIIVIQLSTTIIHFCSMKQAGVYCIYTRTCSGQLYVTDKEVF